MLGRTRIHTRARGSGAGAAGSSLLAQATAYLNGVAPLHWFDFVADRCLYDSEDVGGVSGATGYSFSRASTGYYTNADGTLTSFASGALRRGDRGVLIEGARTNLLLRSQEFDNASWTKSGATVTANAIAAPDGTTTADSMVENTANAIHRVQFSITAAATSHTSSVYVKALGSARRLLINTTAMAGASALFDLTGSGSVVATGGVSYASSTITALANGWYRCSVTGTGTATPAALFFQICRSTHAVATDDTYTGDGTSGLYIWGAQAEAASFPSSYIPTTTASATRAADVLTCTAGVSYPLSLWAEFERAVDTGGAEGLFGAEASGLQYSVLRVDGSDRLDAYMFSSSEQARTPVTGSIAVGVVTKGAGRFATNSVNAARDGSLSTEDTVATAPTTPTTLIFGVVGASPSFGYIRRAAIFNSALSDANLQSVTT